MRPLKRGGPSGYCQPWLRLSKEHSELKKLIPIYFQCAGIDESPSECTETVNDSIVNSNVNTDINDFTVKVEAPSDPHVNPCSTTELPNHEDHISKRKSPRPIDEAKTSNLHSLVNFSLIYKSLNLSPILWKCVPQLRNVNHKNPAAICGVIVKKKHRKVKATKIRKESLKSSASPIPVKPSPDKGVVTQKKNSSHPDSPEKDVIRHAAPDADSTEGVDKLLKATASPRSPAKSSGKTVTAPKWLSPPPAANLVATDLSNPAESAPESKPAVNANSPVNCIYCLVDLIGGDPVARKMCRSCCSFLSDFVRNVRCAEDLACLRDTRCPLQWPVKPCDDDATAADSGFSDGERKEQRSIPVKKWCPPCRVAFCMELGFRLTSLRGPKASNYSILRSLNLASINDAKFQHRGRERQLDRYLDLLKQDVEAIRNHLVARDTVSPDKARVAYALDHFWVRPIYLPSRTELVSLKEHKGQVNIQKATVECAPPQAPKSPDSGETVENHLPTSHDGVVEGLVAVAPSLASPLTSSEVAVTGEMRSSPEWQEEEVTAVNVSSADMCSTDPLDRQLSPMSETMSKPLVPEEVDVEVSASSNTLDGDLGDELECPGPSVEPVACDFSPHGPAGATPPFLCPTTGTLSADVQLTSDEEANPLDSQQQDALFGASASADLYDHGKQESSGEEAVGRDTEPPQKTPHLPADDCAFCHLAAFSLDNYADSQTNNELSAILVKKSRYAITWGPASVQNRRSSGQAPANWNLTCQQPYRDNGAVVDERQQTDTGVSSGFPAKASRSDSLKSAGDASALEEDKENSVVPPSTDSPNHQEVPEGIAISKQLGPGITKEASPPDTASEASPLEAANPTSPPTSEVITCGACLLRIRTAFSQLMRTFPLGVDCLADLLLQADQRGCETSSTDEAVVGQEASQLCSPATRYLHACLTHLLSAFRVVGSAAGQLSAAVGRLLPVGGPLFSPSAPAVSGRTLFDMRVPTATTPIPTQIQFAEKEEPISGVAKCLCCSAHYPFLNYYKLSSEEGEKGEKTTTVCSACLWTYREALTSVTNTPSVLRIANRLASAAKATDDASVPMLSLASRATLVDTARLAYLAALPCAPGCPQREYGLAGAHWLTCSTCVVRRCLRLVPPLRALRPPHWLQRRSRLLATRRGLLLADLDPRLMRDDRLSLVDVEYTSGIVERWLLPPEPRQQLGDLEGSAPDDEKEEDKEENFSDVSESSSAFSTASSSVQSDEEEQGECLSDYGGFGWWDSVESDSSGPQQEQQEEEENECDVDTEPEANEERARELVMKQGDINAETALGGPVPLSAADELAESPTDEKSCPAVPFDQASVASDSSKRRSVSSRDAETAAVVGKRHLKLPQRYRADFENSMSLVRAVRDPARRASKPATAPTLNRRRHGEGGGGARGGQGRPGLSAQRASWLARRRAALVGSHRRRPAPPRKQQDPSSKAVDGSSQRSLKRRAHQVGRRGAGSKRGRRATSVSHGSDWSDSGSAGGGGRQHQRRGGAHGPRVKQVSRPSLANSNNNSEHNRYSPALSAMVHAARLAAVGAKVPGGASPNHAALAATSTFLPSSGSNPGSVDRRSGSPSSRGSHQTAAAAAISTAGQEKSRLAVKSRPGPVEKDVRCGHCPACLGLIQPCGRCDSCRALEMDIPAASKSLIGPCRELICYRRRDSPKTGPRVKLPSKFPPNFGGPTASLSAATSSGKLNSGGDKAHAAQQPSSATSSISLYDTVPSLGRELDMDAWLARAQPAVATGGTGCASAKTASSSGSSYARRRGLASESVYAGRPLTPIPGGDLGMRFHASGGQGDNTADESADADRLRPVEGEVITNELAHHGGYAVVTTTAAAPPKEICYACGSGGSQLLFCVSCAEPFHFYCVERQFRPRRKDHFICRNCTQCRQCGQVGADLRCLRCSSGYHPDCLANFPPAKACKARGTWVCINCTSCVHCGGKPLPPSDQGRSAQTANTSATTATATVPWSTEVDKCAACHAAESNGDICPECDRAYLPDTKQMIQCDRCHLWMHRTCIKLTEDEYEWVALLPPTQLKRFRVCCSVCRRAEEKLTGGGSSRASRFEDGDRLKQLANDSLMDRMTKLAASCTQLSGGGRGSPAGPGDSTLVSAGERRRLSSGGTGAGFLHEGVAGSTSATSVVGARFIPQLDGVFDTESDCDEALHFVRSQKVEPRPMGRNFSLVSPSRVSADLASSGRQLPGQFRGASMPSPSTTSSSASGFPSHYHQRVGGSSPVPWDEPRTRRLSCESSNSTPASEITCPPIQAGWLVHGETPAAWTSPRSLLFRLLTRLLHQLSSHPVYSTQALRLRQLLHWLQVITEALFPWINLTEMAGCVRDVLHQANGDFTKVMQHFVLHSLIEMHELVCPRVAWLAERHLQTKPLGGGGGGGGGAAAANATSSVASATSASSAGCHSVAKLANCHRIIRQHLRSHHPALAEALGRAADMSATMMSSSLALVKQSVMLAVRRPVGGSGAGVDSRCYRPHELRTLDRLRLLTRDEKWIEHWSAIEEQIVIRHFQRHLVQYGRRLTEAASATALNTINGSQTQSGKTGPPPAESAVVDPPTLPDEVSPPPAAGQLMMNHMSLDQAFKDVESLMAADEHRSDSQGEPPASAPPVNTGETCVVDLNGAPKGEEKEDNSCFYFANQLFWMAAKASRWGRNKRGSAIVDLIEEAEDGEDSIDEDVRRCLLCGHHGDGNIEGRLLFTGADTWVHVNCALWSNEVFEEDSGQLIGLSDALRRGRSTVCFDCGRYGATMLCANTDDPSCPLHPQFIANRMTGSFSTAVHFACALRRRPPQPRPVFTADRSWFCSPECHRASARMRLLEAINMQTGQHVVREDEIDSLLEDRQQAEKIKSTVTDDLEPIGLGDFLVCRRVFVSTDCFTQSLCPTSGGNHQPGCLFSTLDTPELHRAARHAVTRLGTSPHSFAFLRCAGLPAADLVITVGSLRVDRLGEIREASDALCLQPGDSPQVAAGASNFLCPVNYRARRIYWSCSKLDARVSYTLHVRQVEVPSSLTPLQSVGDQRPALVSTAVQQPPPPKRPLVQPVPKRSAVQPPRSAVKLIARPAGQPPPTRPAVQPPSTRPPVQTPPTSAVQQQPSPTLPTVQPPLPHAPVAASACQLLHTYSPPLAPAPLPPVNSRLSFLVPSNNSSPLPMAFYTLSTSNTGAQVFPTEYSNIVTTGPLTISNFVPASLVVASPVGVSASLETSSTESVLIQKQLIHPQQQLMQQPQQHRVPAPVVTAVRTLVSQANGSTGLRPGFPGPVGSPVVVCQFPTVVTVSGARAAQSVARPCPSPLPPSSAPPPVRPATRLVSVPHSNASGQSVAMTRATATGQQQPLRKMVVQSTSMRPTTTTMINNSIGSPAAQFISIRMPSATGNTATLAAPVVVGGELKKETPVHQPGTGVYTPHPLHWTTTSSSSSGGQPVLVCPPHPQPSRVRTLTTPTKDVQLASQLSGLFQNLPVVRPRVSQPQIVSSVSVASLTDKQSITMTVGQMKPPQAFTVKTAALIASTTEPAVSAIDDVFKPHLFLQLDGAADIDDDDDGVDDEDDWFPSSAAQSSRSSVGQLVVPMFGRGSKSGNRRPPPEIGAGATSAATPRRSGTDDRLSQRAGGGGERQKAVKRPPSTLASSNGGGSRQPANKRRWLEERNKLQELAHLVSRAKQANHVRLYQKEVEKHARLFRLRFSVDGIVRSASNPGAAWRAVTSRVTALREKHGLPPLIALNENGWVQFGLSHRHVIFLVEQMLGAFHCYQYRFRYHWRKIERLRQKFTPPLPLMEGCARALAWSKARLPASHARDPLSFLSCAANPPPRPLLGGSQRRPASYPCTGPARATSSGPACSGLLLSPTGLRGGTGEPAALLSPNEKLVCAEAAKQAATLVARRLRLPARLRDQCIAEAVVQATGLAVTPDESDGQRKANTTGKPVVSAGVESDDSEADNEEEDGDDSGHGDSDAEGEEYSPAAENEDGEDGDGPSLGSVSAQFSRLVSGCMARLLSVSVHPSRIHGRGLFALRGFREDEMVIEYTGELIRSFICEVRELRYRAAGVDCYMFRIDPDWVIDATYAGNAARFINHSCEPNCYAKVITVDDKKHIIILAQRRIYPGEELTYDYRFPKESDKLICHCGSYSCRKYLN